MKLFNAMTTLRQWEKVTVEKQNDQDEDESTDNVNKKKYVTKLQCWSKQVYVGEVVKFFEASFQEVLVHVNTKRIHTKEFEADKNKKM